jgi:predicted GTPase
MENLFFTKQIQGYLDKRLDEIDKVPVNIGITGDSGSGKSTLINTLRGLSPAQEGAATIGTVETTMAPVAYEHPNYKNIVFWDLPGMGTPSYPRDSYIQQLNMEKKFDFFLIVISGRFSENDLWLAKQLRRMHRPYFFVRSKLDIDIAMKRKHQPNVSDDNVIGEVRRDILKNVPSLKDNDVFILSGELEHRDRWEFPRLRDCILKVLPEVKKNSVIVSLSGYAEELIDTKYRTLKKRLKYYAGASAVGALPPIPGFSIGVDTALLLRMAHDFTHAFGLTNDQVSSFSDRITTRTRLIAIVARTSTMFSAKAIAKLAVSQTTGAAVEEFARYVPFVGQAVAGALSFAATYHAGILMLKQMRKLAREITKELIKEPIELPNV